MPLRGFTNHSGVKVIMVSMTIVMLLSAILELVQCSPDRKIWEPDTPGTCWDPVVLPIYNIFTGGKCLDST
jgi:hypothetical protein